MFSDPDPTCHRSSATDLQHTQTVIDTQIPQLAATDSTLSVNLSPTSVISVRAIPSTMQHNSNVERGSKSRSTHSHRSISRESSTKRIPSPMRHNSNVGRGSKSRSTHSHRSISRESSTKRNSSPMRHNSTVGRRSESRSTHSHRSRSRASSRNRISSPNRHNSNVGRRSESRSTHSHRSRSRESSTKSSSRRSGSRSADSQRSATCVSRDGSIDDSCPSRSSSRNNKSDSNEAEIWQAPLRQNRGSTSNPKIQKIGASVINGGKRPRKQKETPMKPQNKRYERNSDRTGGSISLPSAAYRREIVAASLPFATGVQLPPGCSSSCQSQSLLKGLMKELRSLTKTVVQHQHQSDRRLARMEVSINKALVRLGDITRSNAVQLSDESRHTSHREYSRGSSIEGRNRQNSGQSLWDECSFSISGPSSQRQDLRGSEHRRDINHAPPRSVLRDQRSPEVPIKRLSELAGIDQKLLHREFFTFLVNLFINLVRFLTL